MSRHNRMGARKYHDHDVIEKERSDSHCQQTVADQSNYNGGYCYERDS